MLEWLGLYLFLGSWVGKGAQDSNNVRAISSVPRYITDGSAINQMAELSCVTEITELAKTEKGMSAHITTIF